MCLRTVDKKTKQYKRGYKKFFEQDGKLYSEYMFSATPGQEYYPVNRWFKDVRKRPALIKSTIGKEYPCGFHFYTTKRSKYYRQIKVRNVVASGTQRFSYFGNEYNVGVAKEIYIPYP